MNPRGRFGLLVISLCAAAVLPSCSSDPRSGYTLGTTYNEQFETIAIPMFDNSTFAHGLEAELTDALVKEIHRSTPWRVTSVDRADTSLRGTITDADLRKLTTNSTSGLVESLAARVTVSYEWKRLDTGEVLVSARDFRAGEAFVPAEGANERLAVGQTAAIDQLARDIVASLRSSW